MPNFAPMRDYTYALADEMIDRYALRPPFVDVGCGRGRFSLHLHERHGWNGVAADASPGAAAAARRTLHGTAVDVHDQAIDELGGSFRTVVFSTVIEHIADDEAALRRLRRLLPDEPGRGHLIMSLPTNPECEWRWDDDYYGHYRRYTRPAVEHMLAATGFRLLEFWDYTFPVYWAMRRAYTRVLPTKQPPSDVKEASSAESALTDAWSAGGAGYLVGRIPVWKAVNRVQTRYRHGHRGFEAITLATTA